MDLGRYRVLRPLGRGGMAEVLEAVAVGAEGFERRVAIKRMLPGHEHDEGLVGMFLDEARIASRLHHANIVSVLDFGVLDDQPFQVLELVDGRDAAHLCQRGLDRDRPLPLPLALHIGTTIAHALHHAHTACDGEGQSLGIVHRDVSPANILISWDGDVLLADFGIALAKHRSERTQTGVAKGTVTYWAPEQATGGEIDGRTDVFALAATVHRLITGRSPLAGENALADLLIGRPLPLEPSLPEDVARVLGRALQRDKTLRYPDADEFAAALGACMSRRLEEDPRSALRRWLGSLRDEPKPAASAGALDALLGLEWVVVDEVEGVRTFASHGVTPTPGGTVAAGSTVPAQTMVRPDGAQSAMIEAPVASVPSGSEVARPDPSRRGIGLPVVIAVLLASGGVGFGVWSWLSTRSAETSARAEASGPADGHREPQDPRDRDSGGSSASGSGTGYAPMRGGEDEDESPSRDASTTGASDRSGESSAGSTTTNTNAAVTADPEHAPRTGPAHDRAGRTSGRTSSKDGGRTRPPPEATGTGFLLIGGAGALRAQIIVDGRRHGHAPRKLQLPAGRHRVVLRDDSGGTVAERTVELRATHTKSSPFRWVLPQ